MSAEKPNYARLKMLGNKPVLQTSVIWQEYINNLHLPEEQNMSVEKLTLSPAISPRKWQEVRADPQAHWDFWKTELAPIGYTFTDQEKPEQKPELVINHAQNGCVSEHTAGRVWNK